MPFFFETQIRGIPTSHAQVDKETHAIRLDPIRDQRGQLWVQGTFWTRVQSTQQPQHNPSRYFTALFPVTETVNVDANRSTWNIQGVGVLQMSPDHTNTLTLSPDATLLEAFYSLNEYGGYNGVHYPIRAVQKGKADQLRLDRWPLSNEYGPWTATHPDENFQKVNFHFLQPPYKNRQKLSPAVLIQEVDHQGRSWERLVPWTKEETLDGTFFHLLNYGVIHFITPLELVWEHAGMITSVFPLQRRLSHYASTQLHCHQALDHENKQEKQTDEWMHHYRFVDGSTWTSQRLYEYALKPYWRDERDQTDSWPTYKDQWRVSGLGLGGVAFETSDFQGEQIKLGSDGLLDSIKSVHLSKHIESSRQRFLTFAQTTPVECQTMSAAPSQKDFFLSPSAVHYKLPVRYEWSHDKNAPHFFSTTSHVFR